MIQTKDKEKIIWTRVAYNRRSNGTFQFMNISTSKGSHLGVTPQHVMVIKQPNEQLYLTSAKNLRLGDKLVAQDSIVEITKLETYYDTTKYTLVTEHGTVLAQSLMVSTMCEENLRESYVDFL